MEREGRAEERLLTATGDREGVISGGGRRRLEGYGTASAYGSGTATPDPNNRKKRIQHQFGRAHHH
jgi:hypothetical protein